MGSFDIEKGYDDGNQNMSSFISGIALNSLQRVLDAIGRVGDLASKIGKARLNLSDDGASIVYLPTEPFGGGYVIPVSNGHDTTKSKSQLPVEIINGEEYTRDTSGVGVIHRRADGSSNVSVSPHFTIVPTDPLTPLGFEVGVPREVHEKMSNNTGAVE